MVITELGSKGSKQLIIRLLLTSRFPVALVSRLSGVFVRLVIEVVKVASPLMRAVVSIPNYPVEEYAYAYRYLRLTASWPEIGSRRLKRV